MAETNQYPERMELEELLALLAPLGEGQPTPPALLARLGALRGIVRVGLPSQMKELTLPPGFLERLAKTCPRLTRLDLLRTDLAELSPLAGLKALQALGLDNTQVRELSPLAGLKELQLLSLANTQVRELSPLAGLEQLQMLWLTGLHLDRLPRFCLREGLNLFLEGAVFSQQPEALFRLPKDRILATYYDQPLVKINEGKVIFLGDSGVGKTTPSGASWRGAYKRTTTPSPPPGWTSSPTTAGTGPESASGTSEARRSCGPCTAAS